MAPIRGWCAWSSEDMQGHALCRRLCICVPRASSIAARIPIGFQGDALRLETPTAAVGVQSVARASGVVPIFAPGKPVNRGDRLILRGDHFCCLWNSPPMGTAVGSALLPRGRAGPGLGPARAARCPCGREQVSTSRVQGLTPRPARADPQSDMGYIRRAVFRSGRRQ